MTIQFNPEESFFQIKLQKKDKFSLAGKVFSLHQTFFRYCRGETPMAFLNDRLKVNGSA